MKGSLTIVAIFAVGVLLGLGFNSLSMVNDYSSYVLWGLMFTVGVGVGADKKTLAALSSQSVKLMLLPFVTALGSLIAVMLVSPLITGVSLRESLAIASGFGYYSLSSILITESAGAELGTMALIANIVREISALIAAPLMVRYFSPLGLVAACGATSIDTLLPTITRFSGKEFIVVAIYHGLVMELLVPILVTLFIA